MNNSNDIRIDALISADEEMRFFPQHSPSDRKKLAAIIAERRYMNEIAPFQKHLTVLMNLRVPIHKVTDGKIVATEYKANDELQKSIDEYLNTIEVIREKYAKAIKLIYGI